MTGTARWERLTAAEAETRQRRAAGGLERRGLRAGDRVAFCVGSSAALLCAVLGALRRGIIPVMLNATLLPAEREVLLADAEPALTVVDGEGLAVLEDGPPVELAPVPLGRPMHYTSGTTGRPKGVWSGVLDESRARELFDDEADLWGFDSTDVHLVCSPMYHSVSVRFAGGTLLRGGTVVVLERFDAGAACRAMAEERPTTTFVAPTALGRLLRHHGCPPMFESLRLLVHAGSPCSASIKQSAMARVGPGVLWEFYGSTEGQFTVCSPEEWTAHPGTVGRARPGRRLQLEPDGTVWCHAPSFARFEYWRDPQSTARAWRGDAFTAGDVGRIDEDGYLFLDGRRDDLVISGGVNVYPAEVEAVLARHPGVTEVAVVGLPSEEWGETVVAFVVGDPDLESLQARAAAELAPFKRPREVRLVEALPRNAMGKVLRSRLR